MRRWLGGALAMALTTWGGLAMCLDQYGLSQVSEHPIDIVVVAGAGVMEGGLPGPSLRARTDAAVALHLGGVGDRLAFTGGVGDWPPAEAEVSRSMALDAGVDAARIVVEATSTSTEENAAHLAQVLGSNTRIVVVTDGYHVFRVERVFRRHFASVEGVGVRSPWPVRLRGALREVLAVTLYAATGRLSAT